MAANNHEFSYDKIRLREGKYIELLEKRIKGLEAAVCSDSAGAEGKAASYRESKGLSTTKHEASSDTVTPANQPFKSDPAAPILVRERIKYRNKKEALERDRDPSELQFPKQKPVFTEESSSADGSSQALAHQVIWLRHLSEEETYVSSKFTICAPELKALLRTMLADYPNLHLPPRSKAAPYNRDPIVFESPFAPLIHNWNRLTGLAAKDLDSDNVSPEIAELRSRIAESADGAYLGKKENLDKAREQLNLLLTYLRLTPEVEDYLASLDAQSNARTIQFENIWTIFPPGEVVYSTLFMNEPQLFVVKDSGPQNYVFRHKNRSLRESLFESLLGEIMSELDNNEQKTSPALKWSMVAWMYDWNGTCFQRVPVRFEFDFFTGSRAINTLHCHPLRLHESEDTGSQGGKDCSIAELEKILLDRGRRFRELCVREKGSWMFDYHGDAISHAVGFQNMTLKDSKDQGKKRYIHGRVMVDFQAYLQNVPSSGHFGPVGTAEIVNKDDECRCSTCSANRALSNNQKRHYDGANANNEFEELQYMICPPRVLGYHLQSRNWLELNIGKHQGVPSDSVEGERYLSDVAQPRNNKEFDTLQLDEMQKTLIRDLVQSHVSRTNSKLWVEDIGQNKGRGLVILLHGPPGVGKTLTAESVAQLAGKPLFSVGVSDIGLKPEAVEHQLETLFELAANWQAVLLFDEADVFLESRGSYTSDLDRNALVSVLLRVLEYYDGMLILTTNRIREFDIAVQSRVNLGIKYDDLDREQKLAIFNNFINQVPKDNIDDKERIQNWFKNDTDAKEWTKFLNGRHIRNIVFSAVALARQDGGILKVAHVKKMTKATYMFYDSVKSIVENARLKAEARS
ncbi:hypothetical protein PoHVEF18_009374 [Penicillium ochrochloron]